MRLMFALVALGSIATPALAAPHRSPAPAPYANPALPDLSDPRMADRAGRMAGAMARALMNLPVGEIEAAAEGRPPSPADRNRRIGDQMPPGFDRQIERDTAEGSARMQAMGAAIGRAVPSVIASIERATNEVDHAVGNLPDPNYPRR